MEEDFVSNNEEEMEPNVEMPPQRDIRETQPTISVNYRVVKNMNDNNLKKIKVIQIKILKMTGIMLKMIGRNLN